MGPGSILLRRGYTAYFGYGIPEGRAGKRSAGLCVFENVCAAVRMRHLMSRGTRVDLSRVYIPRHTPPAATSTVHDFLGRRAVPGVALARRDARASRVNGSMQTAQWVSVGARLRWRAAQAGYGGGRRLPLGRPQRVQAALARHAVEEQREPAIAGGAHVEERWSLPMRRDVRWCWWRRRCRSGRGGALTRRRPAGGSAGGRRGGCRRRTAPATA